MDRILKLYGTDETCMVSNAEETLTASGYWDRREERYAVSMDTILTALIHDAGRFCLHHASDLFYDWNCVENALKEWEEQDNTAYIFGFSENSVDNAGAVLKNIETARHYYYRSIRMLTVKKDGDGIACTLTKVNRITK